MMDELNANIESRLKNNEYPGRVIIIGLSDTGSYVIVYAIMGRTANSQNRFFEQVGESIRTAPIDPSIVKDPELIIYNALTQVEIDADSTAFIVTNGRQTDSLTNEIKKKEFKDILKSWNHEPDAPNYTSRISGVIYAHKDRDHKIPKFSLSIIKADPVNPSTESIYEFFEDLPVKLGEGFCISTYVGNGDPLPAFQGAPFNVPLVGNADQIAKKYWGALNPSNRVALVVKVIDPISLESQDYIINK